jgi:hypothetical protein
METHLGRTETRLQQRALSRVIDAYQTEIVALRDAAFKIHEALKRLQDQCPHPATETYLDMTICRPATRCVDCHKDQGV